MISASQTAGPARRRLHGRQLPVPLIGRIAAASRLPFGTTAKVTNLENGRSAIGTVEDRGPSLDGGRSM